MPIAVPLIAAGVGAAGSAYAANQASKGQKASAAAGQAATDYATAEQRRQYDLSRGDNAPWLQAGQGALAQLSRLYGLPTTAQPAMTQPVAQQQPFNGYAAQATPSGNFSVPAYAGRQDGTYAQMMQLVDSGQLQGDPAGGVSTTQVGQAQQVPMTMGQPQTAQDSVQGGGQFDTFWQSPDYNFRQNEQARALTARNAALGIQDSGAAQRSAMQLSGNLASAEYNNYANRLSALAGVGQTAAGQNQALGQNFAGAVGNLAMNNAANLSSSYQNQAAINGQFGQQLAGIGTGLLQNKAFGSLFAR